MTRGRTQAMWAPGTQAAPPIADPPNARIPEDHPARGLVGRILDDRFTIDDVLATGGMSVLYGATDNVLERPVVVKVMRTTGNDATAAQRLVREARSASRFQHPSIVTVFHLGLLETQEPYIVLERLEGHDLEEQLRRRGRFTVGQVGATLAPIADALDTLHRASIVHRDVKPANIFLLDGRLEAPRVKLVDFGLAYLDHVATERLTRQGFVLGTPEYLAPECAKGARAEPSADVYALAVSAYELLTGAPPFEGAALDVMILKASNDAPRIATRLGRELGELGDVLDRALSRRPNLRPSMEELGWALAAARSAAGLDDARERTARAEGADAELPASGTRRRAPASDTPTTPLVPRTGTIALDTRELASLALPEPASERRAEPEAPTLEVATLESPTLAVRSRALANAPDAQVSPSRPWMYATATMTLLFLATLAALAMSLAS